VSSLGSGQKATDTQAENGTHGQLEPRSTTPDRNDRIREIAYSLWLDEGCPEGEAERHWSTAEAMVESEPSERKRIEGEPPGEPVGDSRTIPGVPGAAAKQQQQRRGVPSGKDSVTLS
jgi:hypothetical protein